ncbi:unnamed protein product [Paramecium sonneborni]|uniref:Transmembrane protein n=1 Tax=Paramecium sonneborni TaxID=65129 RepID=A0A8S1L7P7_9CILI|nr:unnamed protein product [Paramecium sonneborni]
MILFIFLISPLFGYLVKQCFIYPQDPNICIEQTQDYSCAFNLQQKACIFFKDTNSGCALNLNKRACLQQLTDQKGKESLCIFDTRCKNASKTSLSKLGCSEMLSKYACMNVKNKKCLWDSTCQEITKKQSNDLDCEKQYEVSVTPLACSILQNLKCMNDGFEKDYQCRTVKQEEYFQLKCSQLGLTEMACLLIETSGEQCIYKNNICQSVQKNEIQNCNQKINRLACLSIDNLNLRCFWNNNKCEDFKLSNQVLKIVENVNINVCAKLNGSYEYIKEKQQCVSISEDKIEKLNCNTLGVSKKVCLGIKSQNCSFYQGYCQELNEEDLETYQCNMELNEMACANLKTLYQDCQWNGDSCERIFMNQDIDCPLKLEDESIKVNGNVCQAISKSDVICKYNSKTNLCIASSINDSCNTPFINLLGCVSIQNNKQQCQWTNNGCVYANIELGKTTCESLGHANPFSCSQVYENDQIGCYYDKNLHKCVSIKVDEDDNQIKTFLNTISCKDLSLGINKVLCASITTEQTPCRWFQEQCSFVIDKNINKVSCQFLDYANYQVCALVQYEKAYCAYSSQFKGCYEFTQNENSKCDIKGLNQYACSLIDQNCYFENNECKNAQLNSQKLKCNSDSPSKKVCLSIKTDGQLCRWSDRHLRCTNVSVNKNQSCLEFINVNRHTCEEVEMEFPDYDPNNPNKDLNRGYCIYDEQENKCKTLDETFSCTTKCCTEVGGINTHSCSRYSSTQIGDYCFFKNGKCQELTINLVDITNPKQVENYYNELKLPCSSMTKNSCHMISWSFRERCIYEGKICNKFEQKYYPDLQLLVMEPYILNKYACLSVEATLSQTNQVKYLIYDEENKRCKKINEQQYNSCEEAQGNRNVCLGHTQNLNCKWNYDNLKCVTISQNELEEMKTCDLSQNIKACNENKYLNCYFDTDSDICIKASPDLNCGQLKNISQLVCKNLTKEPCQYDTKTSRCNMVQNLHSECDQLGINNKACYKLSEKDCRWNSQRLVCYQNQQAISELGCLDNLNKNLCLKITKEPCFWNNNTSQCERFFQITHTQFLAYDSDNKYNQLACLEINEEGYRYKEDKQNCQQIEEYNLPCSELNMNKYACLFQTRGSKCYYENGQCKPYTFDLTDCNSDFDISIEVCLDIPKKCFFNINNLKCENAIIHSTTGCQSLFVSPFDQLDDKYPDGISKQKQNNKEKRYYNKLSCSSISMDLKLDYGDGQCYMDSDNSQQCNSQKYCFWNIATYNCNVYILINSFFDQINHVQNNQTIWVDNDTKELEYVDDKNLNCLKQIDSNESKSQILTKRCKFTNLPCDGSLQCSSFTNKTFSEIKNITELFEQINNQTKYDDECVQYCQPENQDCETNKNLTLTFENKKIKICFSKPFYLKKPQCYLIQNTIKKCDNIYSKAICLEIIEERCYFDEKQGGCRQLKGNEHKVPNCLAIWKECNNSYSKQAICQLQERDKQNQCTTYIEKEKICIKKNNSLFQDKIYYCSDIKQEDAQPIICANASDECRYDGIKCTSEIESELECDRSFSESLCTKSKCNFEYLGYCQQQRLPPITDDEKYKQYLCYEVNLLDTINKQDVCTQVNQACIFQKNICEYVTHLKKCEDLINIISSQVACLRCKDLPMIYNKEDKKCLKFDQNNQENQECENLNYLACRLIITTNCLWKDDKCQKLKNSEETVDCKLLNINYCIKERNDIQDLCWFNQVTQICEKYNPFKGSCDSLKNESTCKLSMVQSCFWDGNKCQIQLPQSKCENLNKFGCLNQQDIPCVWSDKNRTCQQPQFLESSNSCTQFLQNNQQDFVSHMNGQTCTQINVESSCILGQNYFCREIVEPIEYKCETQGLNKQACLMKTSNFCVFQDNKCKTLLINDDGEGCKNNLNKLACLNQKEKCQYKNNKCESFKVTTYNDLFPSDDTQYSNQLCKSLDSTMTYSLIYSQQQNRCMEVIERTITNCGTQGINKFACLSKTLGLCKYINEQCQNIQIQEIEKCDDTLNQIACLANHKIQCKFENLKCSPLSNQDSCSSLQQEKSNINFIVCSKTQDTSCKYNSSKQTCEVVNQDQVEMCSTLGLNEKACIFNTSDSRCKFDQDECKFDQGIAECTDKINKNKCLNLQGKYCYFDKSDGCKEIDSTIDTKNCVSEIEKSAFTCSKAIDNPCFFNESIQKCGLAQLNDEKFFQQNKLSFNRSACLQFKDAKTYWKDDDQVCQEVTEELLNKLKCNDQLNKNACLSLKTQSQLCQFINEKCQTYDQDKKEECQNINEINNGILCSLNEIGDQNCRYNSQKYKCELFQLTQDEKNLSCEEKAQQFYNKKACEINQNCIFLDKCQQQDPNKIYYCSKANNVDQCKKVLQQGCFLLNPQKCSIITTELSQNLQCSQVQNKVGCIQLQTQEQNCRYYDDKCNNENIEEYKYKKCLEITWINNYKFCEQTQDIPSKQVSQDLTCPRGLNRKACIPLNSKSNLCQFFKYCYGNNSEILNCPSNESECCQKAVTKESCLFQTKFKCQWNNNSCIQYREQYSVCNSISNASRNVCYSLLDKFCIFDEINHKCKEIVPEYCDQVQNPQQCSRIPIIPCYWNEDECQFKEKNETDTCSSITNTFGNQQACIQVEKNGQMCAFIDQQCQTFKEIKDGDNCLNNINRNACLNQRQSECYWDSKLLNRKKNIYSNEISIEIGICQKYIPLVENEDQKNFSLVSCLKSRKKGAYFIWLDGKCQNIKSENLKFQDVSKYVNVNSNICTVITDVPVIYDQKLQKCIEIKGTEVVCSYPPNPGVNKKACQQSKDCKWNDDEKTCLIFDYQLPHPKDNNGIRNKESNEQTCQKDGINPIHCTQIYLELPCGGTKEGCDYVDLNKVKCDHIGLNKYACINIKTSPCIWTQNEDDSFYHCEERIPDEQCEEYNQIVNAVLCSMVEYNQPCAYDSLMNTCKKPNENNENCDVLGINAYGCMQIKNCFFQDYKCKLFDQNLNLSCKDAQFANKFVCSQIRNGGCKYDQLQSGCVESQFDDLCSTPQININGCNQIEECQWKDHQCQCIKVLQKFQDCSVYKDFQSCNNSSKCYFDFSFFQQNNQGVCKDLDCSDLQECDIQVENGKVCYKNQKGQCIEANSCNEIQNYNQDCSKYSFNNKKCINDGNKGCIQFEMCEKLNRIECKRQNSNCVLLNSCVTKRCYHIKDQTTCVNFNCSWIKNQCVEPINCSELYSEKDCNINIYNDRQCSWHQLKNDETDISFCTSNGCNYLQKNVYCHGTQINYTVCIQMNSLICLSCEQISDACECMEKNEYCFYDTQKNKCSSLSCEGYNKETCPEKRCFFNQINETCLPQCQFRYNEKQCSLFNKCFWDEQLTPPCQEKDFDVDQEEQDPNFPQSGLLLQISLFYFAIILI